MTVTQNDNVIDEPFDEINQLLNDALRKIEKTYLYPLRLQSWPGKQRFIETQYTYANGHSKN
ncbi:hypothetical protein OMD46_08585 [Pseudomonas sp. MDMC_285]|nr:hypothetical protein [Pseudomonas sp. MDMC_285]